MSEGIAAITNRLKKNFQQIDTIKAFAFGSATHTDARPNDIDILIIYDDPTVPKGIRGLLNGFGNSPIHLIFLTQEEEIETNFIATQRCIPIL